MIHRGTSVIAAVAQNPGGPSVNLSTLIPLAFPDGEQTYPDDFPNHGLIFWYMSRQEVDSPFGPGAVVIASIESADVPENVAFSDRHQYRVELDSVREPNPSELMEVIDCTAIPIAHPRELLLAKDIVLSHRPLRQAYIRTARAIYGPFSTDYTVINASDNEYQVILRPLEDKVGLIEPDLFDSICVSNQVLELEADVSLRPSPPHKSGKVIHCRYQLIFSPGILALRDAKKQFVYAKTPAQILRPLIRTYLDRRKYLVPNELFDEFIDNMGSQRDTLDPNQTEIIDTISSAITHDKGLTRELTDSILASGLLATPIDDGIRARVDQYIADNTAELAATIRERTRGIQLEVEALEKRRLALEADLDARARQATQQLEAERATFSAECENERAKIRLERSELDERRNDVTNYLDEVTTRYNDSRDHVIKEFLTLMPLLERANVVGASQHKEDAGPSALSRAREFPVPAFIRAASPDYEPIDEEVFFARFVSHVEASGFRYREVDLISFHLNFKTSEFFVLGGVSGTGKSSLPRLYAEALAGDATEGAKRFLRIAVNPTWLEVNDLLGRVNVLDRSFNPAETGLFRQLAFAQAEYEEKRAETGMWPVVLDEMNLAQAEHYFGPFLQVFGLDEARTVAAFDPSVIAADDPFARWSTLTLPRSLRFIGTVNFDETTKQLSLRLLDRGALARIDISPPTTNKPSKKASGSAVTLRHFQDWATHTEISRPSSKLLDEINPYLKQLGCPFNPRRRAAIDAFLANVNPSICSPEQAFDLAVSQRVLSLVRGLFRQAARDAFDALEKVIVETSRALPLPECERILREVREKEYNLMLTT